MNELNGIDMVKPVAVKNGYRNGLSKENKESQEPLRGVAVIGLGYWGPNWVRNFQQGQFARRIVACDLDETRRKHVSQRGERLAHRIVPIGRFGIGQRVLNSGRLLELPEPLVGLGDVAEDHALVGSLADALADGQGLL